jgi:protein SCO1/2
MDTVTRWFASDRFAAFVLLLLVLFTGLVLALLLVPPAPSGLGAFAADFRIWCFGQDPRSGRLEWGYVASTVAQPLVLGAIVVAVWQRPLAQALRQPKRLLAPALAALTVVSAAGAGFAAFADRTLGPDTPFPAERLRTALVPPQFTLLNQDGAPVELRGLRGRLVLVTGVYSSCGLTCPMIMGQTRRVIAALSPRQREGLTVVAITLDPARDDPARLKAMAIGQEVDAPLFNLVTGDPPVVESVLDAFGITRRRDPETGIIDHANLFILIDRAGRIAYRFTLGDLQERWLREAIHLLLNEGPSDPADTT